MNVLNIPIIKYIYSILDAIKLPFLQGLSLLSLLKLYVTGIVKGALSNRAGAIAFSFFMALFPFTLFILNLIPLIPINNFQDNFLVFIENTLPPTTFEAVKTIIDDILNNSYKGLLSTGVILSLFLMANGVNAILGGFENSYQVSTSRNFIKQYLWSLVLSLLLSFILLLSVSMIIFFEFLIQTVNIPKFIDQNIPLFQIIRFIFLVMMVLTTVSVLFKFGTRQKFTKSFFNIGSVYTTILIILSSFLFSIYVLKFAKYNELYGSIGTLLIIMFYIWINSMILLSGFELNATIYQLKIKNIIKKTEAYET